MKGAPGERVMDFNLTQGIAVLERTPGTLRAMLHDLDIAWTDATEGAETCSPYAIVGHMIHGERVNWVPRAQLILARGPNRRFMPFDRVAPFRERQSVSLDD